MSIGGIGGIGGSGGNYIPPSGGTPGGGGADDDRSKIGKEKKSEDKKDIKKGDELTLNTMAEHIEYMEAMQSAQLAAIDPIFLEQLASSVAVMADPEFQRRVAELRQRRTIFSGARAAYQKTMSEYPLPILPVPPVMPVNPDPLPNPDISEKDDKIEPHTSEEKL